MEKKESADKLFSEIKPIPKNKLHDFFSMIFKFIIGVCLLPAVYAVTVCFTGQLLKLQVGVIHSFIWGMVVFLLVYLFVWEPVVFFKKGQRILEVFFRFFAPLVKIAPFVLPIYTVLIFTVYLILSKFKDMRSLNQAFIFSIGFSLALHIVFCAKTLRSKQGDSLRSGYIFGFSWIYILDSLLLAFFFNFAFDDFSFLAFFNGSYRLVKAVYLVVFRQLFM